MPIGGHTAPTGAAFIGVTVVYRGQRARVTGHSVEGPLRLRIYCDAPPWPRARWVSASSVTIA